MAYYLHGLFLEHCSKKAKQIKKADKKLSPKHDNNVITSRL